MGNTNTKKIKIPTYEVIKPSIVKTSVVGWHYETDVVEETDCCCAIGIKIEAYQTHPAGRHWQTRP